MLSIRKTFLTGLAVVAIGAVWHGQTIAQENSPSGVVTVFDHEKLNASFTKAVGNGGQRPPMERHLQQGDLQRGYAQSGICESCVQT